MQPENDLLLHVVRRPFENSQIQYIRSIATGRINWTALIALARWHHITPLLYESLRHACPDLVPPDAMQHLRNSCHAGAGHAFSLAEELSRLLTSLASRGISAYPFKGPALSALIYGDPAFRPCQDLDILVRREDVRRAMETFDTLGYRPRQMLAGARLAAFKRSQYELAFSRRDGRVLVELQWDIVPNFFGFSSDSLDVWDKLEQQNFGRYSFPVLPPEETLLTLSVHGTKHLWCRFGWICDVAGLLRAYPSLNWERLLAIAAGEGVQRILLLGLHLAVSMIGVSVPASVSEQISADPMVASLARRIRVEVPGKTVSHDFDSDRYLFYMKARERRSDQLRFATRLANTLAAGSWEPAPLPDSLYPLYYLLRPLVLGQRYGLQLLRNRDRNGLVETR